MAQLYQDPLRPLKVLTPNTNATLSDLTINQSNLINELNQVLINTLEQNRQRLVLGTTGANTGMAFDRLDVGPDALEADFPYAITISSADDTGLTDSTEYYGVVGEAKADATLTGTGVGGFAKGSSAQNGTGVYGYGVFNALTDTTVIYGVSGKATVSASGSGYGVYGWANSYGGAAYGVFGNVSATAAAATLYGGYFQAIDANGAYNVGIQAMAANGSVSSIAIYADGTTNSFYGSAGVLYNAGNIETDGILKADHIAEKTLNHTVVFNNNIGFSGDTPAINDPHGNELLTFVHVGTAVNQITITNAATTAAPTITATGEANVPLKIDAKGTGTLSLNTVSTGNIVFGTAGVTYYFYGTVLNTGGYIQSTFDGGGNAAINGVASGANASNIGVYGHSVGSAASDNGVYGWSEGTGTASYGTVGAATGAATTNYAIYANATGGSTNYSFYGAAGILKNVGTANINNLVITGGTNTFNLTNGTAILDVAAGSTVDINASLTVESASLINQDVTSDASPTWNQGNFTTVHTTTLLVDHIGEHAAAHSIYFDNTIYGGAANFTSNVIITGGYLQASFAGGGNGAINGVATGANASNIGVYGHSVGSAASDNGVYGWSEGTGTASYGTVGAATAAATTNYAIYANATGGGTNYSFYGVAGNIYNAGSIVGNTTIQANTGFIPDANDGAYLGLAATAFSDLFLASGAVIGYANGNYTLTHATGSLQASGPFLVTTDANTTDFPRASLVSSSGNTAYTSTHYTGVIGEGVADANYAGYGAYFFALGSAAQLGCGVAGYATPTASGAGCYGGYFTAKTSSANYSVGVYGNCGVLASTNAAVAYGGYFISAETHTGANNVAVYAQAVNASSSGVNFSWYSDGGRMYQQDVALFGSTANTTDFSATQVIISKANTGVTSFANATGLAVESAASGSTVGIGIYSVANTSSAAACYGVYGKGKVAAATDAYVAYGGVFESNDTHTGANNVAIYAGAGSASGSGVNYSFWGEGGILYNAGDIYTVAFTDISSTFTTTSTGWASFTTRVSYYKKAGKLVHLWFTVEGVSNSTSATAVLPYACSGVVQFGLAYAVDHSLYINGAFAKTTNNSTTLTFYTSGGAAWTDHVNKYVAGYICYQATT